MTWLNIIFHIHRMTSFAFPLSLKCQGSNSHMLGFGFCLEKPLVAMMSGFLEIDLLVIIYLVLCATRDAWSILKTILCMCYRPKCKTLGTGSADTMGMEMSGHSSFRDCGIECVYQLTTSNKVLNFERKYLPFLSIVHFSMFDLACQYVIGYHCFFGIIFPKPSNTFL